MKRISILSVFCVFVAMLSCTMNNEGFLDRDKAFEKEGIHPVCLSFHIASKSDITKSATGESSVPELESADPIENGMLFLLDAADKVVGLAEKKQTNPTEELTVNLLTKMNLATRVIAVVNYNPANQDALMSCNTFEEIKAYREKDPTYRIKVGEQELDWTQIAATDITDDIEVSNAEAPNIDINILVSSATAIVELDEFLVSYVGTGDHPKVELTDVSLIGLKSEGGLFGEADEATISNEYTSIPFVNDKFSGTGLYLRKNVYPNTNPESPIKMRIQFTVGGAKADVYGNPYVREYIVNRPTAEGEYANNSGHEYVTAGHWYVLQVNVTVHTGKVDCSFDCEVKDWVYRSVDLGDISGIKDK